MPMVTATVRIPRSSGIAAAASEPNTASKTIRMIGRFHRSASAMSCLVFDCRGCAQRALADHVQVDPAVVQLSRFVIVDADTAA